MMSWQASGGLKMPRELIEHGKPTDQEFAETKAAMPKKEIVPTGAHVKTGLTAWRWRVKVLVVISLVFLGSIWYNARTGKRTQSLTTAVDVPVTLMDEMEHLPPLAWKAIPLSLPYSGTVDIEMQVVGGNPIDVILTAPDQLDIIEIMEWSNLRAYTDFSAARTKAYRRGGHLAQGGYYLVVRDMYLGMPSSRASDISVKVRLNP
jgi:hypothetical protein